jgi:PKHD-type hydroxylase
MNNDNKHIMIKNFLSKEECEFILNKYLNELNLKPAEVSGGVDISYRKSSVAAIDTIEIIDDRLKDILKNNIKIKGHDVTGLGPYQFTKYDIGDYYNWHTDSDVDEYKDRYCSIVIQLNDDYDGGYLQLKDNNGNTYAFEKGLGNLYIFFSNILHRVIPVKSGIRYSLVNWVSLKKIEGYKKTLL